MKWASCSSCRSRSRRNPGSWSWGSPQHLNYRPVMRQPTRSDSTANGRAVSMQQRTRWHPPLTVQKRAAIWLNSCLDKTKNENASPAEGGKTHR